MVNKHINRCPTAFISHYGKANPKPPRDTTLHTPRVDLNFFFFNGK